MRIGWHDSPISYGAIGRLTVQVPDLPTMHVSSVQLDPLGVAVWLSDLPDADHLSDSIAWFARIAALARRTVSSGRILPTITQEGPFTVARWVYAPNGPDDTAVGDTLTALADSMPAVCTLDSGADVAPDLRPPRRRHRPRAARPVGVASRARQATAARAAGTARHVRRPVEARPGDPRQHRRVRRGDRSSARRARAASPAGRGRAGGHPPAPPDRSGGPPRAVDRAARARRRP